MIPPTTAARAISPARLLYWSIRRELWENRSIVIGPAVAAAVVLFGVMLGLFGLPARMRATLALDPAAQSESLAHPFAFAAILVMATMLIVAVVYCLGALYGERRDRSVLFWKSLPVSDTTTILAKAAIPLAVLPLAAFAVIVATQLVILLVSTAVLLAAGPTAAPYWTQLPLVPMMLEQLYGLIASALWYAPLYAWLLLVSAWARRTPFLWAFLPPLAVCLIERIAFDTWHLGRLLATRLTGWTSLAFLHSAQEGPLGQITPLHLLASPGLWTGLATATAFLTAATWLRRHREPI